MAECAYKLCDRHDELLDPGDQHVVRARHHAIVETSPGTRQTVTRPDEYFHETCFLKAKFEEPGYRRVNE
jgi:hypothetical protein